MEGLCVLLRRRRCFCFCFCFCLCTPPEDLDPLLVNTHVRFGFQRKRDARDAEVLNKLDGTASQLLEEAVLANAKLQAVGAASVRLPVRAVVVISWARVETLWRRDAGLHHLADRGGDCGGDRGTAEAAGRGLPPGAAGGAGGRAGTTRGNAAGRCARAALLQDSAFRQVHLDPMVELVDDLLHAVKVLVEEREEALESRGGGSSVSGVGGVGVRGLLPNHDARVHAANPRLADHVISPQRHKVSATTRAAVVRHDCLVPVVSVNAVKGGQNERPNVARNDGVEVDVHVARGGEGGQLLCVEEGGLVPPATGISSTAAERSLVDGPDGNCGVQASRVVREAHKGDGRREG